MKRKKIFSISIIIAVVIFVSVPIAIQSVLIYTSYRKIKIENLFHKDLNVMIYIGKQNIFEGILKSEKNIEKGVFLKSSGAYKIKIDGKDTGKEIAYDSPSNNFRKKIFTITEDGKIEFEDR